MNPNATHCDPRAAQYIAARLRYVRATLHLLADKLDRQQRNQINSALAFLDEIAEATPEIVEAMSRL